MGSARNVRHRHAVPAFAQARSTGQIGLDGDGDRYRIDAADCAVLSKVRRNAEAVSASTRLQAFRDEEGREA
jgi:hypothetical protein